MLSDDEYALAVQLTASVRSHEIARDWLSEGTPEATFRADYCGSPCQIRIDWLSPLYGIVDLKTCYDLDDFERQVHQYGYLHQLAFYREILAKKMRGQRLPCRFIAVEKGEPMRTGVWECSEKSLAIATRENEEELAYLHHCRDANDWPSGYEEIRTL